MVARAASGKAREAETAHCPLSPNMRALRDSYGYDSVASRQEFLRLVGDAVRGRVLDVGAGSGWMAITAAQQGTRVVSIDLDGGALQRARERASRCRPGVRDQIQFLQADALLLPFPDASFQSVLAYEAVHHLAEPTCPAVVAEMLRVCAEGGGVALADLNAAGLAAVRAVIERTGQSHEENRCGVEVVGELLRARGIPVDRWELEFVTVFIARKPAGEQGRTS